MADPVTLDEVLQHLRLTSTSAEEDTELLNMITAATEYAENITKRNLRGSTVTKHLTSFPSPLYRLKSGITLTKGPVASITSVKYYDTDNVQQTVDPSAYRLVIVDNNSTLYPAIGGNWPSDCNEEPFAIEVIYVLDATGIPQAIKHAILLIVGALYENREDGIIDQGIVALKAPIAAMNLLWPYKLR